MAAPIVPVATTASRWTTFTLLTKSAGFNVLAEVSKHALHTTALWQQVAMTVRVLQMLSFVIIAASAADRLPAELGWLDLLANVFHGSILFKQLYRFQVAQAFFFAAVIFAAVQLLAAAAAIGAKMRGNQYAWAQRFLAVGAGTTG